MVIKIFVDWFSYFPFYNKNYKDLRSTLLIKKSVLQLNFNTILKQINNVFIVCTIIIFKKWTNLNNLKCHGFVLVVVWIRSSWLVKMIVKWCLQSQRKHTEKNSCHGCFLNSMIYLIRHTKPSLLSCQVHFLYLNFFSLLFFFIWIEWKTSNLKREKLLEIVFQTIQRKF